MECRAAVDFALSPDLPAMPANDALNCRQPDSGSLEFLRGMQALKDAEQLGREGGIKAGPIIGYEKNVVPVFVRDADFDPCIDAFAAELPRVAEQVVEHDRQQLRIALSDQPFGDLHGNLALRIL